jgi:hypothetical protein
LVKKIQKRIKKSPGGSFAVPMGLVLTCLYGSRLNGKDFRNQFEAPDVIRDALGAHLGVPVCIADRCLSPSEFQGWILKSSPGRLAGGSLGSGVIPIGLPAGRPDPGHPLLAILPFLAAVDRFGWEAFVELPVAEFSELNRVAFQRGVASSFGLIPGYDQLLYAPPVHARRLNEAVVGLNSMMRHSFEQAGVTYPGPFDKISERLLSQIPLRESFIGGEAIK